MIWFAIGLLAVAALAPLAAALIGRGPPTRGARDLAMDLHRAQLADLDRDLAEGRILPSEHATAVLEVQRRLLGAADLPDTTVRTGPRWPVLAAMALVPAAALGLYLIGGTPGMPSVAPGDGERRQQRLMEEAALVAQLRERLATMDQASDLARQGYILLGNAEAARGNDPAAIEAWQQAMRGKFDPEVAIRIVDATLRNEGTMTTAAAALLRRALAEAPPDAPWRAAADDILKKSGL